MHAGDIDATSPNTLRDMCSKNENQSAGWELGQDFAKTTLERHLFIALRRFGGLVGRGRR